MGGETESGARLARILCEREADILAAWERALRELFAAQRLEPVDVLQGLPELLEHIERTVEAATDEAVPLGAIQAHASARLAEGFDPAQLMREFTLLRSCILELPECSAGCPDVAERRKLDRAIDHTA